MGRVTFHSTGAPFPVIEACGPDDSDISVPLYAHTIQGAIKEIKRNWADHGQEIDRIETLDYGTAGDDIGGARLTLIAVYDPDGMRPVLLVFEHEPEED